jgi:hypothetical protein
MTATVEVDEMPDYLSGASLEDDDAPKRTRRPRKPRDPDAPPVTRAPRNAKLADELLEGYVSFAGDIAGVMPTVSGVLIHRAERSVDGIIGLAQGHPRVMKALRTTAKASKAADVLQTAVLVAAAAMVDLGRLSVDSPILDHLADVQVMKGEDGKPIRDASGRVAKERMTLRDIYEQMTGGPSQAPPEQQYAADPWPTMPSAPMTVPPMNWVP